MSRFPLHMKKARGGARRTGDLPLTCLAPSRPSAGFRATSVKASIAHSRCALSAMRFRAGLVVLLSLFYFMLSLPFGTAAFAATGAEAQAQISTVVRLANAAEGSVRVPNVSGDNKATGTRFTLKESKEILGDKFIVEIAEGCDASDTAYVVAQSPSYGTKVERGSVVTLWTEDSPFVITSLSIGFVDEAGSYVRDPATAGAFPQIAKKGASVDLFGMVQWRSGAVGAAKEQGLEDTDIEWSLDPTMDDAPQKFENELAKVDRWTGTVTAKGDGMVRVYATLKKYNLDEEQPLTAWIDVQIAGQNGAYAVEVSIVNESDVPYGANVVPITAMDSGTYVQFYAHVWYSDGTDYIEKTTAPTPAEGAVFEAIEGLTWSVSSTEIGYIGEETGVFRPERDGTLEVVATVAGGLNGPLTARVKVSINTGHFDEGPGPSDTLTVRVQYENGDLGEAQPKTYTKQSLLALNEGGQPDRCAYTLLKQMGGVYCTLVGEGVYLEKILQDNGIDPKDVSQFSFKATDGVNDARAPASAVLNGGYYYPQCGTYGLSRPQVATKPMIAINSYCRDIVDDEEEKLSELYALMDNEMCFRMCFGIQESDRPNADKNIYMIYEMTVILYDPQIEPDPDDQDPTPPPEENEEPDPETPEDPGESKDDGDDEGDGDGSEGPGDGNGDDQNPTGTGNGTPNQDPTPESPGGDINQNPNQNPGESGGGMFETPQVPQQQLPATGLTATPSPTPSPLDSVITPSMQPDSVVTEVQEYLPETSATPDMLSVPNLASAAMTAESAEEGASSDGATTSDVQKEARKKWQVYQSLRDSDSDVEIDFHNPLIVWAAVLAPAILLAGALYAFARFGYRLRPRAAERIPA